MKKFFNVAGPCFPGQHYMLPAQARCAALLPLVEQQIYFCIHAPRQTGKTTLLKDFVRTLNAGGQYYGLYCTLERAEVARTVADGIRVILQALADHIEDNPALKDKEFARNADLSQPESALRKALRDYCARLDKPLVIMFDEADCLYGEALISFLRQLRDGYVNRDTSPFPHSLALVGMRNIRDYKRQVRDDSETLRSASPFNIVTEALTLRSFTQEEIAALYAQHTEATGQVFPLDVIAAVDRATCGQPWLVNAIAREVVAKILEDDASRPILEAHIAQAIQNIILRRDTHIDSLLRRLKEKRIQRIIEPIILGEERQMDALDDDFQYASDLGLVKREQGAICPANPIYAEVILRMLNYRVQDGLDEGDYPYKAPRYIEGTRLNMSKLLQEFQQFWRENSEMWIELPLYKEAAPHLILAAFLQRVINAQGTIAREYAAGRGRMDLCIWFNGRPYPIEIKLLRRDTEKEITKGVEQLAGYMDTVGAKEGWLVFFDRRPDIAWEEKIFWRTAEAPGGKTAHCVGC
ncbi:MAG: ATP-binding protein [Candidatus Sumerlaeota bacterium]|nr:ATP-binding protein [Candidatus Sumerlaeota bacterium]